MVQPCRAKIAVCAAGLAPKAATYRPLSRSKVQATLPVFSFTTDACFELNTTLKPLSHIYPTLIRGLPTAATWNVECMGADAVESLLRLKVIGPLLAIRSPLAVT